MSYMLINAINKFIILIKKTAVLQRDLAKIIYKILYKIKTIW